jgi:hypothetical protein
VEEAWQYSSLAQQEVNLRLVKIAFWLSLAIWLGGALLTMEYASPVKAIDMLAHGVSDQDATMMSIRAFSVGLFAPISIISGLILAGAWLYRKSTAEGSPQVENAATTRATEKDSAKSEIAAAAQESHPVGGKTLSCNFSGWGRDRNRIVQEYSYRGQGIERRAIVELTVEQGSVSVLRFAHLWLAPATGHQGIGELCLTNVVTRLSTGWITSQLATAAGGMTLMDAKSREGSDAIWRMFSAGDDLD